MVKVAEIVLSFQTLLSTFRNEFVTEGITLESTATDPCIKDTTSPEGKFAVIIASHLLQSAIKKRDSEFCTIGYSSNATNLPPFLTASKHLTYPPVAWDRTTVNGRCQKVVAYQPLGFKVYSVTRVFTNGWGGRSRVFTNR